MSSFTKTLSDLLNEKKITLYSLAKESGIERTLLSKIVSGKRTLTVNSFRKILESLQVSESERNTLKNLYVSEHFGTERLYADLEILRRFSQSSQSESDSDFPEISINLDKDTILIHSRRDLVNIVDAVIGETVHAGKRLKRIYLNFDFDDVYDVIRKYSAYLTDSDFKMLVYFNEDNASDFLNEALKYCDNSLPVRYQTQSTNSDFFPYFIIADEYLILTNSDFSDGVFLKNCLLSDAYAKKYVKAFENAKAFTHHYDDIFTYKESYEKEITWFLKEKSHYAFANDFPSADFMSFDMWEQVARENIPQIEYLKSSVYRFYKNYMESIKCYGYIIPRSALANFSRGGVILQVPTNLTYPLSLENKLKILKNAREFFQREGNMLFVFRDEGNFSFEEPFCFDGEITSTGIASTHLSKINPTVQTRFIGNIGVFFNEQNICRAAKEFFDILSVSSYCYTQKESIEILDEEIRRLEFELAVTESNNHITNFEE